MVPQVTCQRQPGSHLQWQLHLTGACMCSSHDLHTLCIHEHPVSMNELSCQFQVALNNGAGQELSQPGEQRRGWLNDDDLARKLQQR